MNRVKIRLRQRQRQRQHYGSTLARVHLLHTRRLVHRRMHTSGGPTDNSSVPS